MTVGCSSLIPRLLPRAGQRSYVKLLRGRREEPGNEARLFKHATVLIMFDGVYIYIHVERYFKLTYCAVSWAMSEEP